MRNACGLLLILLLPAVALAQSESFVVRIGADTIAVETFVRSANRLEGELAGLALPNRLKYSLDLGNKNDSRAMRFETFPKGADTPSVRGTLTFRQDSVIAQMIRGGVPQADQRFATRPNATPFVNLAFSFVELVTTAVVRKAGDTTSVALFIVGNGVTIPAKMNWLAGDSAVMTVGGVDLHLKMDARGRILRAAVPAQNLTVERVAGTLNRGATLQPDYSAPAGAAYTAHDVTIQATEGHALAGTLTLPKTRSGRIPAVVTISGSGPQDRDEALAGMRGYRPFRELAEALAARGVAVLRYDDRGFGASTGVHATATSEDFANDAREAVKYLRSRSEIDADRIFVIGHSEGGMIAPMMAAQDSKLRGIVLLAAPAHTGRKILEYQTRHAADLRTEKTTSQRDSLYRANLVVLDSMSAQQPWIRYFRDYDPVPTLRQVRVPVLIIHGATDRQVTAEQAGMIAQTLRTAGNVDVAVHVLSDVNHLFLQDPVGDVSGYNALPNRSVVPQLRLLVGDWISNKSK